MASDRNATFPIMALALTLLAAASTVLGIRLMTVPGDAPSFAWVLLASYPMLAFAVVALLRPSPSTIVPQGACLRCSSRLHTTRMPGDRRPRLTCFSCGFEWITDGREKSGASAKIATPVHQD